MSSITYTRLTDVTGPIKPASRVRFNRGLDHEAILAAARVSMHHGGPAYVSPTAYGWAIEFQQPPSWLSHYRVTGRTVEYYKFETGAPKA